MQLYIGGFIFIWLKAALFVFYLITVGLYYANSFCTYVTENLMVKGLDILLVMHYIQNETIR